MLLSRNKKIMYTPVNPSFTIQKWGLKGTKLYRCVFMIHKKLNVLVGVIIIQKWTRVDGNVDGQMNRQQFP